MGRGTAGGRGGGGAAPRAHLARRARVHPRELDVHAHVRVVDVDLLRAADVRQARVVDDRARGRGDREARGRAEAGEELAARLGRDAHRARGEALRGRRDERGRRADKREEGDATPAGG